MKKIFLTVTIFAVLFSCNQTENKQENGENEKADSLSENVHLVLPKTLSDRQKEFESYIVKAMSNIKNFAHNYNWDKYADKPFIDSAMIFDNKKDFKLFPYSNLLIVLRMTTFTNGFTQNIRLRK
jgi:hypothetical protein